MKGKVEHRYTWSYGGEEITTLVNKPPTPHAKKIATFTVLDFDKTLHIEKEPNRTLKIK